MHYASVVGCAILLFVIFDFVTLSNASGATSPMDL